MPDKIEIIAELKDLVSNHLANITSQVDRLDDKLSQAGSNKGIMGSILGANLLTGAIQMATGAMVQFGKDSFYAYGKQEQFLVSLKTMFHGNAEEANALNQQVNAFAKETPFEATEVRDATKQLIAYGSSSGGVIKELKTIGDISSGVGSTLGEVAYLYGTLRTQGRAYTQDIRQFTGRGIPIIAELAKQFKTTDANVMKLVEDGKVGFPEIEKAFQSMTKEGGQFHEMMAAQSKTLLGATSNLADAWDQLKSAVGESQSGILKGTVAWMTGMVSNMTMVAQAANFRDKATSGMYQPKDFSTTMDPYDKRDVRYYDGNNEQVFGKKAALTSERTESGQERFENFSDNIFKKLSTLKVDDAQNLKNELTIMSRELLGNKSAMSPQLFAAEGAVLNQAFKTVNEVMRSASEENNKKKTSATANSSLETLAKANRPTQVIVNIQNLVRELTNIYQSTAQGMGLSTEQVAKALSSAVNDISVLEYQ